MPIQVPANITVITLHGTYLTIGAAIQLQLRGVAAASEVLSISVVRRAIGNNCTAYITYEAAP
jgi:hypothetical protein